MTERASIYELVGIGVEATPGTPVVATKTLSSMRIVPTMDPTVTPYKPSGYKHATVASLDSEMTALKVDGRGTYTELVYPLSSVLTTPTITTPGGATNARDWVWLPSTSGADSPKSYSMEFGSEAVRASYVAYALFREFGLNFSRKGGVASSGAMMAQQMLDDKVRWLKLSGAPAGGTFTITVGAQTTSGIAYNASAGTVQSALEALSNIDVGDVVCSGGALPTNPVRIKFTGQYDKTEIPAISTTDSLTGGTSPASAVTRLSPGRAQVALVPITGPQIDIYTATSYAGLAGASKLTRAFTFDWKIGNRYGPVDVLNSSNGASYAGHVETDPAGTAALKVAADSGHMSYLGNLRANDMLFVRVVATGPAIETGFSYTLTIDTAILLQKPSEIGDQDGIAAIEFSGVWAHDATLGGATKATLRTSLTAL